MDHQQVVVLGLMCIVTSCFWKICHVHFVLASNWVRAHCTATISCCCFSLCNTLAVINGVHSGNWVDVSNLNFFFMSTSPFKYHKMHLFSLNLFVFNKTINFFETTHTLVSLKIIISIKYVVQRCKESFLLCAHVNLCGSMCDDL